MESQGILEDSISPYLFPMVVMNKRENKKRLWFEYRKLNQIKKKDSYPLPHIDELLSVLGGAKYYSTLDALSGFWKIPLSYQTKEKTAFSPGPGLGFYQFTVLPFGLTNTPAVFQRTMETILKPTLWKSAVVLIDDIKIFSNTWEKRLSDLRSVFELFKSTN
ncbi:Retrovirus-related Pol polyprotein from transposon [Smittium culicis]|uniref:Retrovirus-related Pol polyprotein from transposon n=1 Tax=Smittium culicis TaxID=133412 RepID=A0A1R1X0T4_9FUNG|nr:Retrovirus-related Pol polyprotein from transposon [Smittium culicis]